LHHLSVTLYKSPVTIPWFTQYDQAAAGYPPLQPIPHPPVKNPQQSSKSSAETLVYLVWLEAIQILSLIAVTAPKAQHDPQLDWSLISLIDSQFGHASLESKLSGRSTCSWVMTGILDSGWVKTPHWRIAKFLDYPSNLLFFPATQSF